MTAGLAHDRSQPSRRRVRSTASSSPTSPASSPAPTARCCSADLGATVIKVESPAGDDTRTWMPPVKDGVSTYYLSISRNKRSIVLDFRDPDDRELAAELLRRADVAIENFKPGALAKFGLDYESAAQREPSASSTSRSAGSARPRARGCPATT